jgi:hypothetical protein
MPTSPALPVPDFGHAAIATAQSQFAQIVKAMVDVYKDWRAWQAEAGVRLLHTQLDVLQPPGAAVSAQDLAGLPFGLGGDLAAQQKEVLQSLLTRNNTLVDSLRQAQTREEVSLVMAGYLSDVENIWRDSAGKVFGLFNSVNSAAAILGERVLDELIAADPQKKLLPPG